MAHLDDLVGRLPQLSRDGALVRGVLGAPAVEIEVVEEYARAFQDATGEQAIPGAAVLADPERWRDSPSLSDPALVENPRRRVFFSPAGSNLEPLAQFTINQGGIDPVAPSLLFVGT